MIRLVRLLSMALLLGMICARESQPPCQKIHVLCIAVNPGHWTEDMREDALSVAELSDPNLKVRTDILCFEVSLLKLSSQDRLSPSLLQARCFLAGTDWPPRQACLYSCC